MQREVHYGLQSATLEIGEDRLIQVRGGTRSPAVADVSSAVAQAIEKPTAFPPLRQAIVPGDHVAIVLEDGIPEPGDVLDPIIECLADAGVVSTDIRIVQVQRREDGQQLLSPEGLPPGIELVNHQANDRNRLSYLASTKSGTRVYLNREVVDADIVLLVGRVDYDPILGYRGTSAEVFPGLADSVAQQQFIGKIDQAADIKSQAAVRSESDEVAWLLGVQFAIQVVVGEGNEVIDVVAGGWAEVQKRAQRSLDRYWRRRVPRRAELVIAAMGAAPSLQGFEELGRALSNARQLVIPGGRIAVLSALSATPGPALKAFQKQNPALFLASLSRKPANDAISTWQILQACRHAHVFLLSRLNTELVHEMSITPLDSPDAVRPLIEQARSCIVLNDAPFVHVGLEESDEP